MRRAQLRTVDGDRVVGEVILDGSSATFERLAGPALMPIRRRLGDQRTAEIVLDEGWSNGALYLSATVET